MHDLAEAIRTHWSGDISLTQLVPVDRLATGTYRAVDPIQPFATLTFPVTGDAARANDGSTIENVSVRLTITTGDDATDYAEAGELALAIRARFEAATFQLPDDAGRVVDVRVLFGEQIECPESGQWTIHLELLCKVYRP